MFVLHVNQCCTHLVAFLVSLVHPKLSRYQSQINTFVLMSVFIIQSCVNSGHGTGDFCLCVPRISHVQAFTAIGTNFIAFQLSINRFPHLWNSLPPIDLNLSFVTIRKQLIDIFWKSFLAKFNPDISCSYYFACPCPRCFSQPKSSFN